MNIKFKLSLVAICISIAFSCKQKLNVTEIPETPADLTKNVQSIKEMKVPVNFNYETTKDINLTLQLNDDSFGSKYHMVFVYDGNPDAGGSLISSGTASITSPFVAQFKLTAALQNLYVARIKPNGERVVEIVAAQSGTLVHTLLKKNGFLNKKTSPDCNTGCTNTINNQTGQNINVSSGVTCITGTFSGNLNLSGTAEVRICGTATIGNCNITGNTANLIFTTTSVVTFSSSFSTGGTVKNYGQLTVNNNVNVNSNSIFINEGTVNTGITFDVNGAGTLTNNGVILCGKNFNNSNGANATNNCRIQTEENFDNFGAFINNGFIKCKGELTVQGGSGQSFVQNNGAMISTADIQINGNINGTGTTSLIKVSAQTKINAQGAVTGAQQYCDINGIEQNNGTIGSGATISCSAVIPKTSCNTEGNNTNTDTDGDGVDDAFDAYPTDPNRAFNNYYPSSSKYATVSFEDLWPYTADYDINDVVIDFRHNIVTNAQNKVVDLKSKYIYRAHGGNQTTAFAIELPTALTNINTATLTKTAVPTQSAGVLNQVMFETGTNNAVLQLFSNSFNMPFWNTVIGDPRADTIAYEVNFTFKTTYTTATTLAAFGGVTEFNPFIWAVRADKGRGYEIHLPGKNWTNLANTSVFGFANDNTDPSGNGVKYKSKNNLPFAILTPTRFEYPVEVQIAPVPQQDPPIDITQIYLRFAQWSQSGGTLYPDWYSNKSAGYRTAQPWIYTY